MIGGQRIGALKQRWLPAVGVTLIQPILVYFGHPLFGTAINILSFGPPVVATLFFGFRIGFIFAIISTLGTFGVFLHLTGYSVVQGLAPTSVAFSAVTIICFGASRIRAYLEDRRVAEARLRYRERQYRLIFENSADGILCLDDSGVIIDVSPRVETHLGWPQEKLIGRMFDSISAWESDVRESIGRVLAEDSTTGATTTLKINGIRRDSTAMVIECSISSIRAADSPTRWVIMLRDATEKQKMEAELHHTKKMAAVGRLAGGVAHDMNNTLNAILGSAVALKHELSRYNRSFEDLETIASACDRGAQLTRNLLGFARKSSYVKQQFSLNNVLKTVHSLLKRTMAKNVVIEMNFDNDLPLIEGDLGRIENAVMNLCLNALDAMKEGGRLMLAARREGPCVSVIVSDTGSGMDDVVKEQVFEPFFTTKPPGEGTGLGLSMVYGVVKAHDGEIHLDSTPGKGTTVTLSFPALTAQQKLHRSPEVFADPDAERRFLSGKTILIVDDEPLVLRATDRMLRTMSCDVLTAEGGREGIAIYAKEQEKISLVILDLIMPEMDGAATMKELKQINSGLPILLASGYSDEADRVDALTSQKSKVSFLAKPYRAESLIAELKQLLR